MSLIRSYENALLSEASYADLENVSTENQLKTALIASGFAPAPAQGFVERWRVVSHRSDTVSGFSATLSGQRDGAGELAYYEDRATGLVAA